MSMTDSTVVVGEAVLGVVVTETEETGRQGGEGQQGAQQPTSGPTRTGLCLGRPRGAELGRPHGTNDTALQL